VLSLCTGSGTMIEACMQLGRNCLALDIDGMLLRLKIIFFLEVQFKGASARMAATYADIHKETSLHYNGDYSAYVDVLRSRCL